LQGYPANAAGQITTGTLGDIRIQSQDIAPNATSSSAIQFNLDSREAAPTTAFDPTDPSTYNSSTSVTVYNSLGNPAVMTHFFVKNDTAVPVAPATAVWDMHTFIDSGAGPEDTGNTYTLGFTDAGLLTTGGSTTVPVPPATAITHTPAAGTTAQSWSISLDVASSTQFGADFSVSRVDQDGFAPGRLAGIEVDDQGVLFARYTNGESNVLAQLALADFDNPQGLTPLGNTSWAESFASGQPITGSPQSGALGSIQSGALEESNVDLSEELVRLIIAQRNYQANAKTIETSDTVTQALLNIA
jgi:flagellar hook protein FlgE